MASRRVLLAELTGLLLLLLGLLRLLGGVVLLAQGAKAAPGTAASAATLQALGGMLIAVGLLVVLSGIGVLRRRRWSWVLTQVGLVAFVLGGLLNGRLLYGNPKLAGTIGNILVALIIYAALWWSQREGEA